MNYINREWFLRVNGVIEHCMFSRIRLRIRIPAQARANRFAYVIDHGRFVRLCGAEELNARCIELRCK